MIARLKLLLPYCFSISDDLVLSPYEYKYNEYKIIIYPPYQTALDYHAICNSSPAQTEEILKSMNPSNELILNDKILMNGKPSIQANLLQIDFIKDFYDRRIEVVSKDYFNDPSTELILKVVNGLINSIRVVTIGSLIKPVDIDSIILNMEYLTDKGEKLQLQEGYLRGRYKLIFKKSAHGITNEVWDKIQQLEHDYTPPIWYTLVLDADSILPDIGPSLVLAFTAIEVLINNVLNMLASSSEKIPADLWQWINNRGDYRKEPSIEEKFSILLFVLTGKTLKDESDLWEGFKNLKDARNSFVHKGKAVIGKTDVTLEMARKLIRKAMKIIKWIEHEFLPKELKVPELERGIDYKMIY
jgi:hypothetical protein